MAFARSGLPDFEYSVPGDLKRALADAAESWEAAEKTQRLWNEDATLWTGEDEAKWLGWLTIVEEQQADLSKLKALAAQIAEDGFRHFVLLGMGGSSLCPEVFSRTFGVQPNSPELLVLDSTDPLQIRALRDKIDPARTLFCVSSKSGTTLEPNIYLQYFFEETKKVVGGHAGRHFIAVTDPGSKLEELAASHKFRGVFSGLPTIGGRYSALSDFGMVPNAAMGLDTECFLKCAAEMVAACKHPHVSANPGVKLGLLLGTAACRFQRDKVTFICSHTIYDLGAWLEQLLAESTGKEGKGLIPVDREPLFAPEEYGQDRIFAYIKFGNDISTNLDAAVQAIESAGHPVIRIVLHDLHQLGQVFFQWEIATAVAGSVMQINPFDQPDVEASKIVTRQLTEAFEKDGSLPLEKPILQQFGLKLFTDPVNAAALVRRSHPTLGGMIRVHIDRIQPGDYFALLAYVPMFREFEDHLQEIRKLIVSHKQAATVLGFGPRFLHSTGQSYKGGPNSGVFLQITCDEAADMRVPGQRYTFGVVKAAQARGDFSVLAERGRRLLRVHLSKNIGADLARLRDLIAAGLSH
jgi:transaldolase/glucose-6-phosphate isomerase